MVYFVGLDVSVKATSVCVVDDAGKVILEQKIPTEAADIIAVLTSLGVTFGRIGIEAGPLSQWLVNALTAVDLPVVCVETRHMKALLTAQQISKTDRNDARGIAQMMRVGLFKPVHVKTLAAQEQRMLLTSRKLLQRKLLDVESDLRGTLRNFGLRVGVIGGSRYEARVCELVEGLRASVLRRRGNRSWCSRTPPSLPTSGSDRSGSGSPIASTAAGTRMAVCGCTLSADF
jgi:transposase